MKKNKKKTAMRRKVKKAIKKYNSTDGNGKLTTKKTKREMLEEKNNELARDLFGNKLRKAVKEKYELEMYKNEKKRNKKVRDIFDNME